MFSALKKLTRSNDDRCPAPMPMSSSLQKKFSRGVHYNMKILIKGDRNVGKSCLLQRLQGGPFKEEYTPTEQIQVAPIHWTYKNTDFIVKVEVWEVVDKGRTKKKMPLGLKLENQTAPTLPEEGYETPVLDATFLDVYKNATGVILMLDITKPWTFDYVVKELGQIPADLPVIILGNHCDMQHHRQVHPHHIDQAMYNAKMTRTAPIRYAESSMRNGFGLRFLHKFLSVPFLRLQKTSLLEQLQRNQKDTEETEKELDDFLKSDEAHYNTFVDRLANKRRLSTETEPRVNNDRSPSIVLGAGKPIVPPGVNPLLAQSLNPTLVRSSSIPEEKPVKQTSYVSQELINPKGIPTVSMETTPSRIPQESGPSTPSVTNVSVSNSSGALDEFYAGTLDSSFLEDLQPINNVNQDDNYESESDDENTINPRVTIDQDDFDVDSSPPIKPIQTKTSTDYTINSRISKNDSLTNMFNQATISKNTDDNDNIGIISQEQDECLSNEYPLWAGDSSARRSPEGGEDPDVAKEPDQKEKKHKKKKSKDKEKGDYSDRSERKEKKHKRKKSKSDKPTNPQQDLLAPTVTGDFNYEEYDSI
ncbi:rab-like protein 6 [Colias croceus]|uniref:rab-like protein 6 n=1 Tax=Colias crocea TaxID=72248 RepID=UPI001E27BB52|nr:rab-like protein 6 [Colias croceus]